MNHKRKRPKNQRNGCTHCKPHKHQADKDSLKSQTMQEQKSIADFYNQLLNSQEDLGDEFRKVLDDNFWDLLETSNHTEENYDKMELTTHAEELLKKSYYKKGKDGKVIENWEGLCRRVANHIAKGDYCKNHKLRTLLPIVHTYHLYNRKLDKDRQCCGTCSSYEGCSIVKEIEDKFYDLLYNQYFIVNTPSLMNSGTELGGLSACFLINVEDSMESILNAVKQMGIILKTGGGVGFSSAKIRQKGAKVGSTGGVSSGVISWLKIFNQVIEEVKQGGRRRGAGSNTLPVYHPDILEFITCKADNTTITNFNLSVGVTDEFMRKVEADEDYDLIEPHTGKVVKSLSARYVFNLICETAHKWGEPGLFFLDMVNRDNPIPKQGKILSGNPCFEYVSVPFASCTLGAINLSKIITKGVTSEEIDYKLLNSIISTAVRMLDNTITVNKFPIPEIEEVTLANRPIGLGFLNLSELFIKLGLVYGSDESLEMAETITKYMRKKAIETSIELAKERGAYPNFDFMDWYDVNKTYINENKHWGTSDNKKDIVDELKVRNSTVLSIAPNGSTGVIVNASSGGVEPIFAVSYKRKTVDCGDMHMTNPLFEEMVFPLNEENIENTAMGSYQFEKELILSEIEDNAGSVKGVHGVPEKIQQLFVTAREIPYEQHIKMQAAVQKNVDLSISKTCNLLSDATVEDVKNAYTLAHSLGCKGITIYREGSRENEVLSTKKRDAPTTDIKVNDVLDRWDKENKIPTELKNQPNYSYSESLVEAKALGIDTDSLGEANSQHKSLTEQIWEVSSPDTEETYEDEYEYIVEPRERKDMVIGYTYKISLHGMKVYITVNFNEDEMTPIEIFISAGKPGDDINAIAQSIGRLVSLSLKFKVPIDEIMQQIDSMAGDEVVWMGGDKILSIPDAVAKATKWAMKKRHEGKVKTPSIEAPLGIAKEPIKKGDLVYTKDDAITPNKTKNIFDKTKCPNCGDTLVFQEGCRKCLSCDYNKCG